MSNGLKFALSLFVILILFAAGVGYWLVLAPNTPDFEGERGVQIPRNATFPATLDSLENRGVISSRQSISLLGRATGWGGQIKAGYYSFESGASNYEILDRIRKGLQSPVTVIIPPGAQPNRIARVAARDMDFSEDVFEQTIRDSALAAELETDTTNLRGFMLPDSYQFYWLTSPERVVRRVKQSFDQVYEDMRQNATLERDMTKEEVVILASIIEWETDVVDEKATMAGVYLNRLRIGMPLQADPTVQYAILEDEGERRRLLFQDYDIDHPYNTYQISGLPPGPLNNPSRTSIQAVLQPEEHDYLYFVATGDGDHVFSETLREHNRAAQEYRDRMEERRREAQEQPSPAEPSPQ